MNIISIGLYLALFQLFFVFSLEPNSAYAKKRTNAIGKVIKDSKTEVINDSWYTMQAGSSPWGYFHELIEKRHDGISETRISYRYEMTRVEQRRVYQEVLGALSKPDLTPVTFNLVKSTQGTNEIINGTFSKNKHGHPQISISIDGLKRLRYKRTLKSSTILESFFPVWISQNWKKLKDGTRKRVSVFTEDPKMKQFLTKTASVESIKFDTSKNCRILKVKLANIKSQWCVDQSGRLQEMMVGNNEIQIKRVKDENTAKEFLSGVLPKEEE